MPFFKNKNTQIKSTKIHKYQVSTFFRASRIVAAMLNTITNESVYGYDEGDLKNAGINK